jgi:excisionase family DNA binding protein
VSLRQTGFGPFHRHRPLEATENLVAGGDDERKGSMNTKIFYSVHEAAEAAGIGLTKLREEIRAQRLIARKLGRRTLISAEDLNTWASNLPQLEGGRRV